jgi:hypothetical protein
MKRTSGLAFAVCFAAFIYGCGEDTPPDQMTGNLQPTGGTSATGGIGGGGAGGNAATGSTWAPVTGGFGGTGVSGASGFGGMGSPAGSGGTSGLGGTGGVGGPVGGTGGVGGPVGGMGGPAGSGGSGGSMIGSGMPTIPAVAGDCPDFVDGVISFMGLGGIRVAAGPKPSSATAPMVFYWHGTLSSAGEYVGMAGAVAAGVTGEGGILVAFDGTTGGDLLSGTSIFGAGDFEIADQLVACAVQNHNVDPRRIYATGCSAGGLFSTAMAAKRSSYLAAAAPNSGGLTVPVPFENDYTPPLMTIHGAPGSDVVFIDFSNSSATADEAFKGRGGFVINCNHGGGHCGGGGLAGDIWEFFKAHPYGVDPNPWESSLPAGFHSSCELF